jgi:hypothetical protein
MQRRVWTTWSLQRAEFQLGPDPNSLSRLFLPYPSPDGEMLLCPLGAIEPGAAERWTPGAYDAVLRVDRAHRRRAGLAGREEEAGRANREIGGELERALAASEVELDGAERELDRAFDVGLKARTGMRLVEDELLTYAHIAARLPPRTGWRACERCDLVFQARRNTRLCRGCHGQRRPGLRPASPWRQCTACDALFEPTDAQQSTCDRCRTTKSTRSRNPDRPVQPGTPYRRATIDVALPLGATGLIDPSREAPRHQ